MMTRLVEWLWSLNSKNRTWLADQMPTTETSDAELARIDAEIKAALEAISYTAAHELVRAAHRG